GRLSELHPWLASSTIVTYPGRLWKEGAAAQFAATALLREADFADHFGVARIGVQGVEQEVGAERGKGGVVFLEGGGEPLEGMVFVAEIGIVLGDLVGRDVTGLGFASREGNLDALAQRGRPSARAEACFCARGEATVVGVALQLSAGLPLPKHVLIFALAPVHERPLGVSSAKGGIVG